MEPINADQFEVIDGVIHKVVDVANKTCSCGVWQLDLFPCSHAFAALWRLNLKPMDFIPQYYTQKGYVATYSMDVNPIEHEGDWVLPPEAQLIHPPIHKVQAGRPKLKRYRAKSETFHPYHQRCGKCGRAGHNKRSCKL